MKNISFLVLTLLVLTNAFGQANDGNYPVSVSSLQAAIKSQTAVLEWKTVCYLTYANFKIERSTDGINFTTINSFSADRLRCQQPFQFQDVDLPAQSRVFYRVNAGDLDGNFFNSKIASILNNQSASSFKIFPTVASSTINVAYNAPANERLTIKWVNASGSVVQTARVNAVRGNNQFSFNVAALGNGVYYISIAGSQQSFTGKLVKQ